MSERSRDRLALGAAAVLTPRQAANLLPWSDAEAREWLRQQGLIRVVDGREVVIWGRVVEAIDAAGSGLDEPVPAPPRRPRSRKKSEPLPRVRIEPIRSSR